MGPQCADNEDCAPGNVCYNATILYANITHPDFVPNFDTTYRELMDMTYCMNA